MCDAAAAGTGVDVADDDDDRASRGRSRRRSEVASRRSASAAGDLTSDFVCSTGAACGIQHTITASRLAFNDSHDWSRSASLTQHEQ